MTKRAGTYLIVLGFLLAGCDRQIPVSPPSTQISGYQIEGTVTDPVGNPIPNVTVKLFYEFGYTPADTNASRWYFVGNSTVFTQAIVVDGNDQVIRALTAPTKYYGLFQALWDGKDSSRAVVPSGIYRVEYVVGGQIVFLYNQIVDGGTVAMTDSSGHYLVSTKYLPIDFSTDPLFYFDPYVVNLPISNNVFVRFAYPSHVREMEVTVNKNVNTVVNVMFQ
jgi:hypothetical protein